MSRRKQARPIKHLDEDGTPIVDGVVTCKDATTPSAPTITTPEDITMMESTLTPAAEITEHGTTDVDNANVPSVEDEITSVRQQLHHPEPHLHHHQHDVDLQQYSDTLMCPRCQEQFTNVQEFLTHKEQCALKAIKHEEPVHSDPEDMVVSEEEEDEDDDEDDDDTGGKRLERMRRHRQDAANNNSVDESSPDEESATVAAAAAAARLGFPFPVPAPGGHVTLEALQNTKVAVAQFAATALANNADNETALQELAVLQSTLFTLQHQQVMQLQLINQLQQQLSINRSKPGSPVSTLHETDTEATPTESPPPRPISRESSPVPLPPTPIAESPMQQMASMSESIAEIIVPSPLPLQHMQTPVHCSISSSLASTIITHNNEPPSMDAPNTLEMLQKRAQEVLDNASQGLLATNLADELAFRKSKGSMSPYDSKGRNEPFFKHRCRYCGKVFGSDSALQIHIRSHTGERPFKCNVCGSRFTTKGNLKVHFQRHSSKFPHIKMNPNPIPEHLDKYHPPLLAQLGQQPELSPGGPSSHPPPMGFPGSHSYPHSSLPLYRPPAPPPEIINNRLPLSPHRPIEGPRLFPHNSLFMKREEQDLPENLSKPIRSPTPNCESHCKSESADDKPQSTEDTSKVVECDQPPIAISPKQEMDTDVEQENERFPSPIPYDECSLDSKYSNEDGLGQRSPTNEQSENMQDEPENLSSKSCSLNIPLSISTGQRIPANFPFGHSGQFNKYDHAASSPPSSTSSGSIGPFPNMPSADPSRDPAMYANLLPRPGSNDNSWESLIEVTKTSETSKLQQLVDNIEHKLSDPNQCVICHRVLSCKSALQMHYRTHTGERPFKCKICGRAFTTKGNLKTHMGVHRAKPPMRVLHQCPVCHKKFTNALVLQQHIRLHTGEPTDLTPEQIQAAEVKDYPSPGGFPPIPNSINPFLSHGFQVPGLSPIGPGGFPMNMKLGDFDRDMRSEQDYNMDDDDDDDDDDDMNSENNMTAYSTSPGVDHSAIPNFGPSNNQLSLSGMSFTGEDMCSSRVVPSLPPSPLQNGGDKSPAPSVITSPGSAELRTSPNHIMPTSTPVQMSRPPSVVQQLQQQQQQHEQPEQPISPSPSESNSLGALDLTPKTLVQPPASTSPPGPSPGPPSIFSSFGLMPPTPGNSPLMSSALSSLTSSVLTSTAFSPLRLAVGPAVMSMRGNTTCNLCFKTFACNSALEIHYRSHTKERPFKCTVCDRGFSTKECVCEQRRIQDDSEQPVKARSRKPASALRRTAAPSIFPLSASPGYATALHWNVLAPGNMKQHMLTHKIRDMPQHMFDGSPHHPSQQLPPHLKDEHSPNNSNNIRQNNNDLTLHMDSEQQQQQQQHQSLPSPLPPPPAPALPLPPPPPPPPPIQQAMQQTSLPISLQTPPMLQPPELMKQEHSSAKRAPLEAELPMPKRPPSGLHQQASKHLCHVCNKNFSSSSALQIHMRTHTGDKPFRCTVCQKAFTTKGNLKVHMGTHMWSNGASRRGRRMSLDLPPIPMTPKDSEFLQRRPDLFYPYLPAPFLNGMQQKLNEISVVQNASPNGGGLAGKYSGLLGFGYPPPLPHQGPPSTTSSSSNNNNNNNTPNVDVAALRSLVGSPPPDRPPSTPPPPQHLPPTSVSSGIASLLREPERLWDLHFERKSAAAAAAAAAAAMAAVNAEHHHGSVVASHHSVRDDLMTAAPPPQSREGLAA